jgi:hypothetical protein
MTQLLPTNLDYTGLDQLTLEQRVARLLERLYPNLDEADRAALGNILFRLIAFVGDTTAFYQDNQARESHWTTARLRRSILSFAKMLGYRPATARPATVVETFALDAALPGDLVIPASTRVLTAEITAAIAYQLTTDLTLPAGTTTATAVMENSETKIEVFTSSELPDQAFRLQRTPFIDGSLAITAGNGVFTEVDDLLDSTSTSRNFTVEVDERDRATVTFGDGVLGRIPTGNITCRYRVGGGVKGRVEAGRLTRLEGSFTDALGNPARLSVTNAAKSAGGDDRETNAQIRLNGPRASRIGKALVGRDDYEIAAEQVPGVARALHLPDTLGPNQGLVLVVPDDLSTASAGLLASVEAQWGPGGPYKKLNTYQVTAIAAPFLVANVSSVLYLSARTTRAQGRAAIVAALTDLFALNVLDPDTKELVRNPRINFGYYFKDSDGNPANRMPWSDIFNAIRDTSGIRSVDPGPGGLTINGVRDDLVLAAQQFPKLGSITLIDGTTGEVF